MRCLPKCYILHTDLSEFRELGKTCQATCFPLSTLNHWSFTEHTSWPVQTTTPKIPSMRLMSLDHEPKNEMMCHELEPGALMPFCVNRALLGFRRDFPKIHDNVDVVQVANEMKPCGVKNLSSTGLNNKTQERNKDRVYL